MIKLKDILKEIGPRSWKGDGPAWNSTTLKAVKEFHVPLSVPFFKKLFGQMDSSTFHMTDLKGLRNLEKLVGKKSPVSTFNAITNTSDLAMGKGIQTKGGVLIHLTGELLLSSISDITSYPDESGRRWISSGYLNFLTDDMFWTGHIVPAFNKTKSKKYWNNYGKTHEIEIDKEFNKWRKANPDWNKGDPLPKDAPQQYPNYDDETPWYEAFDGEATNKEKSELIKDYIDAVQKVLLKYKSKIRKKFGSNIKRFGQYDDWNELLVYNIKIEDILLTPKIWKKLSDSEKKKIETTSSGKVIYAKSVRKEIKSFIVSRKGKVK